MGDYEMELAQKEFGRWFVSKANKLANASEHYLSAANKYKTAKEYKKSAAAFEKHANALETLGESSFKICDSYKNAAVQLKLAQDPKCIDMYDKAVNVLCNQGKHSQAAKMCKEMGELAAKARDYDEALMHFEKAVDLFQSDDYPVQARRVLEKVAELQVQKDPPDFSKSADLYEELAKACLEERLTRSVARKHFFRAAICVIAAGDAVLAREKGDLFLRLDPSLGTGREGKLMQTLIKALEDYDVTTFTQSVTSYNEISKFDAWHVKVLLAGKSHIDPEMSSAGAESPKELSSASAGAAAAPAVAASSSIATKKSTTAYAGSGGGASAASALATSTASASMDKPTAKAPLYEPMGDTGGDAAPTIPSAGETTHIDDIDDVDSDDDCENFFG